MAPLRGWARRGRRLNGYAPHGHWRTMTFLAALRADGISALCVFDGPINRRRERLALAGTLDRTGADVPAPRTTD